MKVFKQIRETIDRQPPGAILALEDFNLPMEQLGALTKALSRLYKQGRLRRLVKGLYFKPVQGILGEINTPSYDQLLEKLLVLYKDKVSYLTGVQVYSSMSLTTQISNSFEIATDKPRSPVQIGSTCVRFVRSRVTEPVENIFIVQLLDAIADIKNIPATTPAKASRVLLGHLRRLTTEQRQELAKFAQVYPPQARALTGLLLETLAEKILAKQLKASLNPLTTFDLTLDPTVFPTSSTWKIQ
ncbi:MAG: DUF6088 family protein [Candidatus Sericytochromatia bacterium]